MKKSCILLFVLLASICTSYSQQKKSIVVKKIENAKFDYPLNAIKVSSQINNGNDSFCPGNIIDITLKCENVPFDVFNERLDIKNLIVLNQDSWKKVKSGSFEKQLRIQIDPQLRDFYAYIFVYSVSDNDTNRIKSNNVNQLAFVLKNFNPNTTAKIVK